VLRRKHAIAPSWRVSLPFAKEYDEKEGDLSVRCRRHLRRAWRIAFMVAKRKEHGSRLARDSCICSQVRTRARQWQTPCGGMRRGRRAPTRAARRASAKQPASDQILSEPTARPSAPAPGSPLTSDEEDRRRERAIFTGPGARLAEP
jgi:hypothetical protein